MSKTSISKIITSVDSYTPAATTRNIRSATVEIDSDHLLTIQGTTTAPADASIKTKTVLCTLIRHSTNKGDEDYMSTSLVTRFAQTNKDNNWVWNVQFSVSYEATYLTTCHSRDHKSDTTDPNDYVEIVVSSVKKSRALEYHPRHTVEVINATFSPTKITANGTVLNAQDSVTCSLTPVNCPNGTSGSEAPSVVVDFPGPTPSENFQTGNVPPPPPPTLGAPQIELTGVVVQDGTSWNVSFTAPTNPASPFTGCYLLQVSAAGEGMVTYAGSVSP